MFTDNIFRLGHHLAQGLCHRDLGAGDCISRNDLALCYRTDQTHYFLRSSDGSCTVELFFDFAGHLNSERKRGRAEQSMAPWQRDLVLYRSQRHEDRAEPANIANTGRLRSLGGAPAERLPHHSLHMLWIKPLTSTHNAALECSLELEFLGPQPLVFELGDERAL
jgi:hypothetical protein